MTSKFSDNSLSGLLHRWSWWIIAALTLAVYVFVIGGSINKPFGTDEIYYAGWAWGIAHTGAPVYYSGEDVGLHPLLVEPISHPTLHFKALALMVLAFGMKYWSLRLLGVFLFVGLLLFIRFKLFKGDPRANERWIFTAFLMVFSPMFMQESLVLAIEAQAFWFPMVVFLYLFHKESVGENRFRWYPFLYTTPLLIVLLWLKETNIPIYLTVCLLYLIITKNHRKIPGFAFAFVVSLAVFWATWVAYCMFSGADVWSWYNFTFKNKMLTGSEGIHRIIAKEGLGAALDVVLFGIKISTSWLSASYVALFFIAIFIRIRDIVLGRRVIGFFELCLLYTIVLFGVTKFARPTPSFVKYEVPAHVLMAIFVADVYFDMIRKEAESLLYVLVLGIAAGVALHSVIPDRHLEVHTYFSAHVLQSLGLAILVSVAFVLLKRRTLVAVVIGLLAATVTLNSNLYTHQSTEDYTTGHSWGNYGEDLVAPIQWLRMHMKNGDGLAAFKDIQFNMRFVEGKTKSPTHEVRLFSRMKQKRSKAEQILRSGAIRYVVLSRYSDSKRGRLFLKRNNYREVARAGKHIIYERRAPRARKKNRSSNPRRWHRRDD